PVLDRVHDPIADPDRSPGGVLESADHPQRRGLPTTRGPEEAHEIAVLNGQIEVVDGVRGAATIVFRAVLKFDRRHISHLTLLRGGSLLVLVRVAAREGRRWRSSIRRRWRPRRTRNQPGSTNTSLTRRCPASPATPPGSAL